MSDSTPITVDDMKQFLQAFNNHDADAIVAYCTDDVTFVTIRENKEVSGNLLAPRSRMPPIAPHTPAPMFAGHSAPCRE